MTIKNDFWLLEETQIWKLSQNFTLIKTRIQNPRSDAIDLVILLLLLLYHFHWQSAKPRCNENVYRQWREAGMLIFKISWFVKMTPVYKYVWSLRSQVSPLNWGGTIKANLNMASNNTRDCDFCNSVSYWRCLKPMEYVYFEPPSLQKKRGLEWSQLQVVACKNWPLEKITIW